MTYHITKINKGSYSYLADSDAKVEHCERAMGETSISCNIFLVTTITQRLINYREIGDSYQSFLSCINNEKGFNLNVQQKLIIKRVLQSRYSRVAL